MKTFIKSLLILLTAVFTGKAYAGKVILEDGDLSALKGQVTVKFDFVYKMAVADGNEKTFVKAQTDALNKKEPGKGDAWAKAWVDDRKTKYEPGLVEQFQQATEIEPALQARYTIIFKTIAIDPGIESKKPCRIEAQIQLIETVNPKKILAKLTLEDARGTTSGDDVLTVSARITEAYETAGKLLGKFIKDKLEKL